MREIPAVVDLDQKMRYKMLIFDIALVLTYAMSVCKNVMMINRIE